MIAGSPVVDMEGAGWVVRRGARRCGISAKRKHYENGTFYGSLNFDAPHRANARTHAQAETANRLLSLCSIESSKENHPKS